MATVLEIDEKLRMPSEKLKRVQLYTYWLAEGIQSRKKDPESERRFICYEGNPKHTRLYEFKLKPNATHRAKNLDTYFVMVLAIQTTLIHIIVSDELNSSLRFIHQARLLENLCDDCKKLLRMLTNVMNRGGNISQLEYERILKFKTFVDQWKIQDDKIHFENSEISFID